MFSAPSAITAARDSPAMLRVQWNKTQLDKTSKSTSQNLYYSIHHTCTSFPMKGNRSRTNWVEKIDGSVVLFSCRKVICIPDSNSDVCIVGLTLLFVLILIVRLVCTWNCGWAACGDRGNPICEPCLPCRWRYSRGALLTRLCTLIRVITNKRSSYMCLHVCSVRVIVGINIVRVLPPGFAL
jgi:hypothetical protein